MLKKITPYLLFGLFALTGLQAAIPIKVVVVSMFEIGEDTGDIPGEFQFWIERNEVKKIEAPLGWRDYYLRDDGLLIMCTGGGITNAATSVTALALDDRFDLSKAYWIVAGIAGADPEDCSLGSAAWAKWVIDGDLAKEIDSREIPEEWPYGMIALGAKRPNTLDDGWQVETIKFELNEGLVDWAYELTKDYPLPENEEINEFSEIYSGYPNATKPPFVMIGDSLASSTYWHGFALNDWANDWVKLHTNGEGNFVMSNMEDTGTATALQRVAKTGKVDFERLLVLRTASNFSTPPIGKDVVWSLFAKYPANGVPALEAAHALSTEVADALIKDWDEYADTIPGN
ncbi:purine-nucleoside phosphorylase [Coraliomargarita parva]|uniref:purine-nucleoside phosphorylase n=1 Tax=Coraliomargarita parva TaxID=3014050 RepID=UPI0022B54BDE|nr:purine nucleoside permease [Coraliomargarita parva]